MRLPSLKPSLKRGLFCAGLATLVLVVALVAAYSVHSWNRLHEIPDIGEPFDVDAWLPPEIPDDENAATLHRQAFALLSQAAAPLPDGKFLAVTDPLCDLLQQAGGMPKVLFYRPEMLDMYSYSAAVDETGALRRTFLVVQARARILRSRGEFASVGRDLISIVKLARVWMGNRSILCPGRYLWLATLARSNWSELFACSSSSPRICLSHATSRRRNDHRSFTSILKCRRSTEFRSWGETLWLCST